MANANLPFKPYKGRKTITALLKMVNVLLLILLFPQSPSTGLTAKEFKEVGTHACIITSMKQGYTSCSSYKEEMKKRIEVDGTDKGYIGGIRRKRRSRKRERSV
jgi:hypothetical protein